MKFFVIDIEQYIDDTNSKAIYEYATADEAVASYHSRMGSAMKNANVKDVLVSVIDSKGGGYGQSYWERKQEGVE